MDFIYKEHVACPQVGQDGSQISRAFNGRPGGDLDVDAHLVGHHMRQGSFSQAGRSIKKHMIERFSALDGGLYQDTQVFLDIFLPDQVRQRLWAQCLVEAVIRFRFRVEQAFR